MTKAHSEVGDNNGLCERCNRPESAYEGQTTHPVLLGGGLGWGTMWLCPRCKADKEQEAAKTAEAQASKPPTTWEQIRALQKRLDERDLGCDQVKMDRLRDQRRQEIRAELPHACCCKLAETSLRVARNVDWRTDKVLDEGKPRWFMTVKDHQDLDVGVTIHFCPFCGVKLPDLRKKASPPPNMCVEGAFSCGGCGERYDSCYCSPPEAAWEIVVPATVCCKCRPVLFLVRTKKAHLQLECYCEDHAKGGRAQSRQNAREITENEFRNLAGWGIVP